MLTTVTPNKEKNKNKNNIVIPWKLVYIPRAIVSGNDYQLLTRECFRLDADALLNCPPICFENIQTWEKTIKIRLTRHWMEDRLKPYVNKPTKNGQDVEITDAEYTWLFHSNLHSLLGTNHCRLVEVGFNQNIYVCKLGYVITLHTIDTLSPFLKHPNRWLFICLGVDGGLKTAYITSCYKYRRTYGGKIPYFRWENVTKMVNSFSVQFDKKINTK